MTAGIDVDPAERKATADGFNINGLKRLDASVTSVLLSASHVVLYQLKEDLNQWDRCDVEGALFLVQLDTNHSSNPDNVRYRLFIINRKSLDNYVDDILIGNKDMDFSEKMIMYCNSKRVIVGLWFYEQQEADQFHALLKKIVEGDSSPSASTNLSASINAHMPPPDSEYSPRPASLPLSTTSVPSGALPTGTTPGPAQPSHSRPKRPPRRSTKPPNQAFNSDRRDNQTGQNSRSRREPRRDSRSSLTSSMTKPNGTTSGGPHPASRRDSYATKRSSNINVSHNPQSSNVKTVLSSNKPQSSKPPYGKIQAATKNSSAPKFVKSQAGTKPKVDESLARLFPDLSISEGSASTTLPAGAPDSAIFESDAVSTMIKAPVPAGSTRDAATSAAKSNTGTESIAAVPMTPAMDEAIIAAAAPIQPSEEVAPTASTSAPSVSIALPIDSKTSILHEKETTGDKQVQEVASVKYDSKTGDRETADVVEVVDIAPKVKTEQEVVAVENEPAIRDTKPFKNTRRFNKNENHVIGSRVESRDHSNMKQVEPTLKKNYGEETSTDAVEVNAPVENDEHGPKIDSTNGNNEKPMIQVPLPGLSHGRPIGGGVGMGMGMVGMGMGMGVAMGMGMPPRGTMGMDDNVMPMPMLSGMGIPHGVHPMGAGGTFGGMHPQMAMVMHQQHQQHQQQQNMLMMHHIIQQQRHMHQMHAVPSPASSPVAPGVMPPPQLVRPGLNIPPGSAPPQVGMPPSSIIGHTVDVGHHGIFPESGTSVAVNHGNEGGVSIEERMGHSVAHAHKNGISGTNPSASLDRSAFRAVVQRMLTDRKLFDRVYEHFTRNVRER